MSKPRHAAALRSASLRCSGQRRQFILASRAMLIGPILLLASAAHAADNFDNAVLADNPLAYFTLNSVNDPSSVGGYTTTFNAGATVTAPGGGAPILSDPTNVGASFNGTVDPAGSGYGYAPSISTSFGPSTSLTAGTVLGWFDIAQTPGQNGAADIEYIAGESQGGNDLDLQVQNNNNLYFYTAGGAEINAPITLNQYHFFAATFDSSTGATNLYVDGSSVASGITASGTKDSQFTIGDSPVFSGRNFDGSIDDVAVYNSVLSSSQITSIYDSASSLSAAPEPSQFGLMGLVGLGLGAGLLRARKKRVA